MEVLIGLKQVGKILNGLQEAMGENITCSSSLHVSLCALLLLLFLFTAVLLSASLTYL